MVTETFERVSELKSSMKAGKLTIVLKRAKHIRGHEFMCFGRADMYAVLTIGGEKRKSKVVHKGGSHTVWDEELSFKIAEYVNFALYDFLHVNLYDDDVKRDSPRGTVKIDVESLLKSHQNNVPLKSYPVMYKGRQRGSVELAFTFVPK